jgi:hypothetical protein
MGRVALQKSLEPGMESPAIRSAGVQAGQVFLIINLFTAGL